MHSANFLAAQEPGQINYVDGDLCLLRRQFTMKPSEHVRLRLKTLLEDGEQTASAIAKDGNVTRQTVTNIVEGRTAKVSLNFVEDYCAARELSVEEFLGFGAPTVELSENDFGKILDFIFSNTDRMSRPGATLRIAIELSLSGRPLAEILAYLEGRVDRDVEIAAPANDGSTSTGRDRSSSEK